MSYLRDSDFFGNMRRKLRNARVSNLLKFAKIYTNFSAVFIREVGTK